MLLSRDGRYRRLATAAALLGMVCALLLVLCAPSSARAESGTAAVATAQGQLAGCGKGAQDDERGAHPATAPRGGALQELPPAPHGVFSTADTLDSAPLQVVMPPDRGPPIAAVTPLELSILRV
ncbi:hypothetical protein [Streptomyces albipurpureus]|uniref:Secreted protein n=1 Tax=Streptomyces albipurpureus TaxID=2897419 RepID=A0ABT0URT7_9ACTN|nr:hypothetical protein [Streptomyces sp. CWNU-1]MCM2390936.1 hypothetical protein [Streptomyces sp. CWNU-1]